MRMPSRFTFHVSRSLIFILIITLGAFVLRLWRLDSVPPGWRDDELINSLVISQKVLDGDWAVYYADASGHEALYHALNAIFLGLFGPGVAGIRWLSVVAGTTAVPLIYLLARRLFDKRTGLIAAAGLGLSFWSLMYSRIGLRHILMPLLVLGAFFFFWRGFQATDSGLKIKDWRLIFNLQSSIFNYLFAAVFMGLGFYTYFAGRGVPLILIAFGGYVLLFDRERFRRHWRGWMAMLGITAVLALPLLFTLNQQPESEARVAELAVPLVEAQVGNYAPLWEHIRITLNMFHSDGDGEWLYNIPHRPVFGLVGAIFFWMGIAIAFWHALQPLVSHFAFYVLRFSNHKPQPASHHALAAAFLLIWWLAGIAPGFISVPPASLGHTILAQPAVYLLAALPIWQAGNWIQTKNRKSDANKHGFNRRLFPFVFLAMVLLTSIAIRDLPDYFVEWPQRGMVQFLYRADIQELADFLNTNQMADFGVSGLLAGPWDKLALEVGLDEDVPATARWFNPERVLFLEPALSFINYPDIEATFAAWYEPELHPKWGEVQVGSYVLNRVTRVVDAADPVCFVNGLCAVTAVYNPDTHILEITWQVGRDVALPDIPLISNPPPPGVYNGPRLFVFGHLLDADGNLLAGDDGLWVDPTTLQVGDLFMQRHRLVVSELSGGETAVFGLYDPLTGQRIQTEAGQDRLQATISHENE